MVQNDCRAAIGSLHHLQQVLNAKLFLSCLNVGLNSLAAGLHGAEQVSSEHELGARESAGAAYGLPGLHLLFIRQVTVSDVFDGGVLDICQGGASHPRLPVGNRLPGWKAELFRLPLSQLLANGVRPPQRLGGS